MFKHTIFFFKIFFLNILLLGQTSCTMIWRAVKSGRPSIKHTDKFPKKTITKAPNSSFFFVENEKKLLPPLKEWLHEYENPHQAQDLSDFLDKTTTTAFIVMRNDSILYEKYSNGHQKEGNQLVFSVTKSFVTTLLAIAIAEGHIQSLEQKVSEFLPEFKDGKRDDIRLQDVLQMTSGLNFDDYGGLPQLIRTYQNPNLRRLTKNAKLAHPPSTYFAYKSIDTQVLAFCIEVATKRDLTEYFQEKIWHPLGMNYDAYFTVDSKKHQNERTFGGFIAKSRDLLRFGKLFLDNGQWNGQQIVPQVWIEQIKKRKEGKNGQWWGYQNGWWREGYLDKNLMDGTDFYAVGYQGQFIYVHPEANVVIVRQGLKKGGVNWNNVIGSLLVKLQNKETKDYSIYFTGVYKDEKKEVVKIARENGQWILYPKNGKKPLQMKQYCPQSLYDSKTYIRTIFDVDTLTQEVKGLHYDDFKTVIYFEKEAER